MSSTGNTIATQAPRRPALARVAFPIVERVFRGLEGGTLEARLPAGRLDTPLRLRPDRPSRRARRPALLARRDARLDRPRRGLPGGLVALGRPPSASSSCLLENAALGRERHPRLSRFLQARPRSNRRQGLLAARRNIAAHYDLGNDLFELMLDPTLTYSCAIFESLDESLKEDAQRRTHFRHVCRSSSSSRGIACSRSAVAGARSRSSPPVSSART